MEQPSPGGAVKALVPPDATEHVDRVDVDALLHGEGRAVFLDLGLPASEHLGDAHFEAVLGLLRPAPPAAAALLLLLGGAALALAPVLLLDALEEGVELGGLGPGLLQEGGGQGGLGGGAGAGGSRQGPLSDHLARYWSSWTL